jgi:hypothetical protein
VDIDILKPNTGYVSIERPTHSSSSKGTSELQTPGSGTPSDPDLDHDSRIAYAEPESEDEGDEERAFEQAKDEDKRTGLTGLQVAEAVAHRERVLKERRDEPQDGKGPRARDTAHEHEEGQDADGDDEGSSSGKRKILPRRDVLSPDAASPAVGQAHGGGKPRALSIDPLAPSSAFDQTLRNRLRSKTATEASNGESRTAVDEEPQQIEDNAPSGSSGGIGDDRILVRDWRAPIGKRIAVPVRIEPKVYFAAERTFLVSSPSRL